MEENLPLVGYPILHRWIMKDLSVLLLAFFEMVFSSVDIEGNRATNGGTFFQISLTK